MAPPALRRARTAVARPMMPRSAPSSRVLMRGARELRTGGVRAAASATTRVMGKVVPIMRITTVTDTRVSPRMVNSCHPT